MLLKVITRALRKTSATLSPVMFQPVVGVSARGGCGFLTVKSALRVWQEALLLPVGSAARGGGRLFTSPSGLKRFHRCFLGVSEDTCSVLACLGSSGVSDLLRCGLSPSYWRVLGLVVLVRGCGGAAVLAVVVYGSSEAAQSLPLNFLPLPGYSILSFVELCRLKLSIWLARIRFLVLPFSGLRSFGLNFCGRFGVVEVVQLVIEHFSKVRVP
ncbi:hypothetical protein Bca52824_001873 [Brassica carinata]|uniref:Uncharacterized protein n=1 Tax=Brassica carinata TaxID=52824 RepID=A0A8X7WGX5_BRACI|nr:hypothetical protein Bca52824_001873 [Brassica carinata]